RGHLGVGEVHHHPRRGLQLQRGEGERPITVDHHPAGAVVPAHPDAEHARLLLRVHPEGECERAAHECERRGAHDAPTLARGRNHPKDSAGAGRALRAAYSTRSFTSEQIWWMSVPMVSSRWLFSFTGRQSRYSLRAARQIPRVLLAEAILSMSPKKI